MIHAYLNEIGTAVPPQEAQQQFLETLDDWISDDAAISKLRAIAKRSGVKRRYTVLANALGERGSGAFYEIGNFPGTARRMQAYREQAPRLAVEAARALEAR